MMHALTIDNLSFRYLPEVPTLRDVSFVVHRGEFLTLVGPNGSGKSTLLKLLARILIPHQGRILLGARDVSTFSRVDLARRIGYVPQERDLHFSYTVEEIVLMGRSPHARGMLFESDQDRLVASSMMALTDIAHLASHPIGALSGGERQRVFIARALAQQPDILLLDEPNAHLDIAHQVEIFRLLKRLNNESGLTVVSVSHDLNLAAMNSDRIALLLCGSLVAIDQPETVLTEARIREAFSTNVLVDRHPAMNAPRVTLLG
jgi:iron complex transport system ATP-binding protein